MSHGKSVRLLATAAILAALGYALLSRLQRDQPAGGDADLELTIARERGAAWYCEEVWDKAREALERVASHPQATPQDLVNLACVKLRLYADDSKKQARETPEIEALCKRALERDPKLATAHYVLGAIALDRGAAASSKENAAAARPHFEQAVANAPDDVAAKLRLANVLEEMGERDRAIAVYEEVRERGPEFAGAFYLPAVYRLARGLQMRKQGDDAKRSAELRGEHKRLSEAGMTSADNKELELGTLARVKIPPGKGGATRAAASAGAVRFEPLPPLLADELAEITSFDVADVDSDLRDDVVVAGVDAKGQGALWLLKQDEKGAFAPTKLRDGKFARVIALDLENELGMSLLLVGDGALQLLAPDPAPEGKGGFVDVSAQLPPLPKQVNDVAGVDFGHDGQLDLALATAEGVKLVRNDGVPKDQFDKKRTGPIQLKDVSTEATMPAGDFGWVTFEDFDGDQDVDLLMGGPAAPTTLASSLRKGRFELLDPPKSGLPASIARQPLVADLDHDGKPDLLVPGNPPAFARNRGNGTFEAAKPLAELAPLFESNDATLADVDLDGELDLVGVAADGTIAARLLALGGAGGSTLALGGAPAPGASPRLADLDDDGDLDLVSLAGKGGRGIVIRCGSVKGANSLLLQLRGQKDNRQAIGAVVEVRALDLYQRRMATERQQLFGLGDRKSADVLRITWPNGVVQCFVSPATPDPKDSKEPPPPPRACGGAPHGEQPVATILPVPQKEGLAGSCPFLYSWNGERYVFVTDVLGTTPLGLPISEHMYVPPDHDELVRLTSDQLAPVDGEFRMQFTEELREVTFLDRAQLWVVDHPAEVAVHPEERFSFPPFPPQHVHTVKAALPLVKAVDQEGRDWTRQLASVDHVHAVPFVPLDSRYLGLVTAHWLDLTLPDAVKSAKKVRLLMNGWLEWTDASVNLLADRNGSVHFVPPLISVPDPASPSGWREAGPPVGFPAGKTKTMVLDVTSMLNRADPRLRIFSTIRLYWDQIEVAVDDDDAPVTITKLEPTKAELWHRGFSAPIACEADDQPARFDWDVLEPTARWNQHAGMLTRLGEVAPLLVGIDDRFAILSAGDAVDLRFDARTIAPPKPGMARTFLLFVDGWAKDADPNTTFSQSVEPLPFHGMSGYPYGPDEHYPDDAAHADYQLEWNTRPARRLIPDLAPSPRTTTPESP